MDRYKIATINIVRLQLFLHIRMVLSFLANKPVSVEEDPSPFEVGWGLRKMDTTIGDSKAAAEWTMSIVERHMSRSICNH